MLWKMTAAEIRAPGSNWAGNHTYPAERLHRPASMAELQEVVSTAASVHVLGSRHSFNGIADAADLISLEVLHTEQAVPAAVAIDTDGRTVSFGGGVTYGELVERLNDHDLALHNMASLRRCGGDGDPRFGRRQRQPRHGGRGAGGRHLDRRDRADPPR
jgi:xylitol oxidase